MAELRKALKAGSTGGQLAMARRWVAAWRGRAARTGKAAALGPLKDEEGVTLSQVGHVGRMADG
jgi:hypothetical protein